jgi:AcrR family transcriptional regulator
VRGPGRPRDPAADRAILEATVELLGERGYGGLRIEDVARRARVGKATVYRRWPSKLPLVLEALARASEEQVPFPDTGDLVGDITVLLERFVAALGTPFGRALTRLLGEAAPDPALRAAVHAELIQRRQQALRRVIERGILSGVLRPDLDVDLVLELGTAVVLYRLLVGDRPVELDVVKEVLDLLLTGIASPGGASLLTTAPGAPPTAAAPASATPPSRGPARARGG